MNTIQIERINKTLPVPRQQTEGAGGLDLYAAISSPWFVYPQETVAVPTGIAVGIPKGHVGIIKGRSGLAKLGVDVLGGVIDADYRGEVHVLLSSLQESGTRLEPGARIAQLVVVPCLTQVQEVESLDETARGANGFGHTGV